jgi:MYXO-CTERM domain-containing protein
VQIWEGTSDTTVVPANQAELVKQWTNVWGIDQTADETETIGQATRAGYKSGSTVAVETYSVQGMSHAVSVGADPSGACTATAGQYFEDHHVCATLRAARFFGLTGNLGSGSGSGSGDEGAPTVAIVSPADGDMVSGAVTVVVAAGAAQSVDLTIDGAAAGTDSDAPYQFMWDATQPGPHTLVATAHGATQDATAMATVTVASGSGGGGGGSNSDNPGPGDLPGCSLDAGKGGLGLAPLAMVAVAVLRRRRQRV